MTENKFIAVVGATGAGKDTFLDMVKERVPKEPCVFLCDSSGSGADAPHARFTTRVTQLVREGIHTETTPRSEVLVFWSRLQPIIEQEVLPALKEGKWVFINGFGGTILANAMLRARSSLEREALLELHKSMIKHCVVDMDVPPPTYLWLRVSPEVAFTRRQKSGSLAPNVSLEDIERLNEEFEFYGKIPGQTVIPIDADRSKEQVFGEGLTHINADRGLQPAA